MAEAHGGKAEGGAVVEDGLQAPFRVQCGLASSTSEAGVGWDSISSVAWRGVPCAGEVQVVNGYEHVDALAGLLFGEQVKQQCAGGVEVHGEFATAPHVHSRRYRE